MVSLPASELKTHSDLIATGINEPKNGEQEPATHLDATREAAAVTPNSFSSNNTTGKSNLDTSDEPNDPKPRVYHTGWRLHALTAA